MNEDNQPRAASGLRRLVEGVRHGLRRLRPSTHATGAVEEYVRVVPVLAGQVRESSSEIEHSRWAVRLLLDQSAKNTQLAMEAVAHMDRIALGLRILAFNAKIECSDDADELSHHADQATAAAENIRATMRDLETSLGLALDNLPPPGVNERLQQVIETLSEMQGDFVAALHRPEARSAFSGTAALRLRQRYTRAAAPIV